MFYVAGVLFLSNELFLNCHFLSWSNFRRDDSEQPNKYSSFHVKRNLELHCNVGKIYGKRDILFKSVYIVNNENDAEEINKNLLLRTNYTRLNITSEVILNTRLNISSEIILNGVCRCINIQGVNGVIRQATF